MKSEVLTNSELLELIAEHGNGFNWPADIVERIIFSHQELAEQAGEYRDYITLLRKENDSD